MRERFRKNSMRPRGVVVNPNNNSSDVARVNVFDKNRLDIKINLRGKYHCIKNALSNSGKIVAYTSISPKHVNSENQIIAIESWHKLGIKVYSLNTIEEINILKKSFPKWVKFINSNKTTKHIFGKPCIFIGEMMDHFRNNNTGDILMLINSDVILNPPDVLMDKIKCMSELCVTISHRNDYEVDLKTNNKYTLGFDVFFIHKKYINIFPKSMYSMGQTWWDYWIPYTAIKNKIPVFIIEEAFAFHKKHPNQYNANDWIKMTEYFKWENGISGSNQSVNDTIISEIKKNAISFKL